MMKELEQLKAIVLEGDFTGDDKQEVLQLEQKLKEAIAAEKLASHPAIKSYLDYLSDEVFRCNLILSETEDLSEPERRKFYERKRQCRRFQELFGTNRADIE